MHADSHILTAGPQQAAPDWGFELFAEERCQN